MKEVKTGLVLEGGAMRGMYTAGILDVLMEEKIQVDGVIGVSAGAVFGCNYKSGQIGRTLRYNMKFCGDKRYGTLHSLLKTGDIYDVDLCYHQIPEILDPFDNEAFVKNPAEFFVVCTDVETGKAVYHKCTDCGRDDLKWMQASASMPLVSKVVEIDGYKLLDGGVARPSRDGRVRCRYFRCRFCGTGDDSDFGCRFDYVELGVQTCPCDRDLIFDDQVFGLFCFSHCDCAHLQTPSVCLRFITS